MEVILNPPLAFISTSNPSASTLGVTPKELPIHPLLHISTATTFCNQFLTGLLTLPLAIHSPMEQPDDFFNPQELIENIYIGLCHTLGTELLKPLLMS